MVTIRRLRRQDNLRDLIELSREFFDEYAIHHEEFFQIDALQDSDVVEYFSRFLDTEHRAVFVATRGDRIVGYITVYVRQQPGYWKVKGVGEISGLMVSTEHRRQGIARRLLIEAKTFFRAKGIEYFTAYTASANRPAMRFYEQQGMTPLHVTLLGRTTGAEAAE